jgi:MarR family transcriptional repressor of emrRAB
MKQVQDMEAGLARLAQHVPDLPQIQILTSRLLVHLGRELSSMVDQRLKPHGLNDMEFRTLMNVYSHRESPAYPSDLCASLSQSPANITRITDALVERGLMTRLPDEHDRRRLLLRTTAQGEQLVQTLLPVMLESVRDSYRGFSTEDVQQILGSLKRLAKAIDEVNESASLEKHA